MKISAWNPGFKVVSAIQLLKHYSSLNLAECKSRIDGLIEGKGFQIEIVGDADKFKTEMESLGGIIDSTDL